MRCQLKGDYCLAQSSCLPYTWTAPNFYLASGDRFRARGTGPGLEPSLRSYSSHSLEKESQIHVCHRNYFSKHADYMWQSGQSHSGENLLCSSSYNVTPILIFFTNHSGQTNSNLG